MSKLVTISADIHVGNHKKCGGSVFSSINRRCQEIVNVVDLLPTGFHYVLGDLFDDDHPVPQVITKVVEALPASTTVLLGNHDMHSDEPGDHALNVMRNTYGIHIADMPQWNEGLCLIPYKRMNAREWLMAAVETHESASMFCHLGIADSTTPPWLAKAHDAVHVDQLFTIMKDNGLKSCFAGNWHQFKHWERNDMQIVQVGALVPTGWDNPGFDGYGTVITLDTETHVYTREELPGPRFVTVRDPDDLVFNVAMARAKNCLLYAKVVVPHSDMDNMVKLATRLKEDGMGLHDFCVEPDGTGAVEATRDAATAATGADSIAEAVAAYVDKMPVVEQVDKGAVLEKCRKYLGVG